MYNIPVFRLTEEKKKIKCVGAPVLVPLYKPARFQGG